MSTELKRIIEGASIMAEKIFARDGELHPVWIAETDYGPPVALMTPWNSEGEKQEYLAVLRDLFRDQGVRRYVSIIEAWTANIRTNDPDPRHLPRAKDHPDRREVVVIHAADDAGNVALAMRYILRPEHGKAVLSPLHFSDATDVGGDLVSVLPVRGTRH